MPAANLLWEGPNGLLNNMAHRASGRGANRAVRGRDRNGAAPVRLVLDVDRYGGQWIATLRGQVVASGRTLLDVNRAADAGGYGPETLLTKVPRSGDVAL